MEKSRLFSNSFFKFQYCFCKYIKLRKFLVIKSKFFFQLNFSRFPWKFRSKVWDSSWSNSTILAFPSLPKFCWKFSKFCKNFIFEIIKMEKLPSKERDCFDFESSWVDTIRCIHDFSDIVDAHGFFQESFTNLNELRDFVLKFELNWFNDFFGILVWEIDYLISCLHQIQGHFLQIFNSFTINPT